MTMNRTDALKIAREHVEAMAVTGTTQSYRGSQTATPFAEKIAAVEKLARFLMEPDGDDIAEASDTPAGPKPGDRYRDGQGDSWTYGEDGRLHYPTVAGNPGGSSVANVESQYGPLTPLDGAPAL